MARLGPSGLAQLFREIANYVSTRLSNYNTKSELDSLLDTKADDNNVIHTSGAEIIDGIKTFTSDPRVTNNQTTMGYSITNTALTRNDVPSKYYHHTFRAYDKNNKILGEYCIEKSTNGDALLNMGVRSEDDSGTQIAYGLQFRMTNDGSLVRFLPSANNKVHLGDPSAKWLKVHSDDVVHTSGSEDISGYKKFTNNVYMKNNSIDVTTIPTADQFSAYGFIDKNEKTLSTIQYVQRTTGANDLSLFVLDKDSGLHGIQLNTNNELRPRENNVYSLGSSNLKWSKVYSDDIVHTSGDEYIHGTKIFSGVIHRYADLTTSGGAQVYRFDDTNANACGHIYNNVHWVGDCIYNRYGAYNNKSGKTMEIDITSNDAGVGIAYVAGTATKGNLETVTSATGHTGIATMGWVSNPSTSTNVVHRTGDETLAGTKTFTDITVSNKELHYRDTVYDWTNTSLNTWCNAGHVAWYDKTGNRRMHELVGAQNGVWRKACYINENQYFSIDSNRNISYWGTVAFNGHTIFTQDMIFKNSNIDLTVTPSSTLYSNFIFTDKNNQNLSYIQYAKRNEEPDILGLYVNDKNKGLHGIQITSNNYLLPFGNNIWNLGSPNNVWASSYIARMYCANIVRPVEDSYIYMTAGPAWNRGASIFLNGKSGDGNGTGVGTFTIYARDSTNERRLLGYANGILSWNGCIESHEVRSTTVNAFMAQYGSYTFLIRNDGSNTYFLMSDKDGVPGTWSTARPLIISNATGTCSINGNANSATYSTTQAVSDNSTKIATTAYVKSQGYVNLTSLAGGNSAGSLNHSVGSLVLANCHYSAFYGTKLYANVAGQQLYPCRTEIYTSYSYGFTSIVVLGNDSSLGSGTWRYLGGSDGDFNNASGRVYGMFLRVA